MDIINGRLSGGDDHITHVFDGIAADHRGDKIVVHFHGGLIHGGVADEFAGELLPVYLGRGNAYPLLWVWNSGFLQMTETFKGVVNRRLVRELIKRFLDILDGPDVADELGLQMDVEEIASLSTWSKLPVTKLLGHSKRSKLLARVKGRLGKRALSMLIVEETLRALGIGRVMRDTWAAMKRSIDAAFTPGGAGTAFLGRLAATWGGARRVTLVGHSAGAIYLLRMLKAADQLLPSAVKFDVVFLAPACSFAEMYELRDVLNRRVRSLQMFSLQDTRERAVYELNKIYPGSILYLISGLLEEQPDTPIVGMQRFHLDPSHDGPDAVAVRAALRAATVWAPTDAEPLPSTASNHTQFDDHDKLTIRSVCRLLDGTVMAPPFAGL